MEQGKKGKGLRVSKDVREIKGGLGGEEVGRVAAREEAEVHDRSSGESASLATTIATDATSAVATHRRLCRRYCCC